MNNPTRPVGNRTNHKSAPAVDRVLARVEIVERGYGTPCWCFSGSKRSGGYGQIFAGCPTGGTQILRRSHRVVYEALVGAIADDMTLDHLCRVKECCNPAHLEPVTRETNSRRAGRARRQVVANTGACRRGHPLSAQSHYAAHNKRGDVTFNCRACGREAQRRYMEKSRSSHVGEAK